MQRGIQNRILRAVSEPSTPKTMFLTCVVMLVSAVFCGFLPLYIGPSDSSKVMVMGCIGAGAMLATAFAVVIPEGYMAYIESGEAMQHSHGLGNGGSEHHAHPHSPGTKELPHWAPGAVLTLGFIVMLLLEQAQHASKESPSIGQYQHDSDPEEGLVGVTRRHLAGAPHGPHVDMPHDAAFRALVGLLIHCAADGLAVGAASLSSSTSLSFSVAMAMALHKGPTAFGLTSYLLTAKWTTVQIMQAIFLFSIASPVFTVITYVLLSIIPALASQTAISLCVLFSGGTFLYAACMHILPEIMGDGALTAPQLAYLLAGAAAPVGFSMWHTH
eukprot:jgi/Botrbrau1/9483/Bobra.0252s0101.1